MNTPVERLQALLERVTENRNRPRAPAAPSPIVAAAPAPIATAAPRMAAFEPKAPEAFAAPRPAPAAIPLQTVRGVPPAAMPEPARAKPKAPTPLELAVEGRISQPTASQPS